MTSSTYVFTKRAMDIAAALAGLLLTAPIQLAVAATVRHQLGTPVLFRQERPGLHAKPFTLLKFRTMRHRDPASGLISDADRLTPFGALLRETSLDELPTLWNVLKGDMSLVGPRPLLTEYIDIYSARHARRHCVRPGITGLAQVNGRNNLDWQSRLDLDIEYVSRRSLGMDLRILLRTLGTVLKRTGISHEDHPTMPPLTTSYDSTPDHADE